jgi:5'-nucleotidase
MRRPLLVTAVAALALLLLTPVAGGAGAPQPPAPDLWLTVLHNNDGESQLLNAPGQPDFGGIARFKTLVGELKFQATKGPEALGRSAKGGVLMLSSGDNFLAGPQFKASLDKGAPFYDSIGLDLVGYDAMAIGNHEFDFGPDVLADFIGGFRMGRTPFLSANLDFSDEAKLKKLVQQKRIAESVIVNTRGERIGIVGATTPSLPFISSPRNVHVIADVAGEVQKEIDALEERKINKIILISHLQSVSEDLALIPQLSGLDVAIAGGGDELLANPGDLLVPGDVLNPSLPYPLSATNADGDSVPVITTSGDYKYVGKLVVAFDKDGNLLDVDEDSSGPVRVSGVAPDAVLPDPTVQAQVVDPVAAYVAALAQNVIAQSQVALEGRRGPTPPGVRTVETNLGNLMADALLWEGQQLAASFGVTPPNVGLQNGGGIRNNSLIPAGPITELTTFAIAPFGNFVSVVPDIPPAQFKEILENAVSRVEFVDGRFAQVAGFRFTWDAAGTAQILDGSGNVTTPGTRVQEVQLDDGTMIVAGGAVVAGAPNVHIATNDFSARGGDQWPFRGAPFTTIGVTYQQALSNFLQDGLGGLITSADYPEGGEGRITRLN